MKTPALPWWETFDFGRQVVFLARAMKTKVKNSAMTSLCIGRAKGQMSIWHFCRRFVGNPGGTF